MFGKNKYQQVLELLEEEAHKLQIKLEDENEGLVQKSIDLCCKTYLSELTDKIKNL